VDRYTFIVVDLHHLLLVGLPAHFESYMPSHAVGSQWRVYLRAAPFALMSERMRFSSVMEPGSSTSRSYICNSGGGAPNSHARNGPTPPGTYRVSNYRPNRTTTGMVLNGVGFSFDLNPVDGTRVYGRSLFRIHPDGGNPGTNGCLGIREDREKLREAETSVTNLLRNSGPFKLVVTHNL